MSASVTLPVAGRMSQKTLSLRTKGMLALAIRVTYVAGTAWFLSGERHALYVIAQQIDSHHAAQALVAPSFNTLAHTVVQTQAILSAPDYSDGVKPTYAEIALSLDPLVTRLAQLRDFDPTLAPHIDALHEAVEAVRAVPSGRNLGAVRNAEQMMIAHLNDVLSSLEHRSEVLERAYREKQQLIGITAVGTSALAATSAPVTL